MISDKANVENGTAKNTKYHLVWYPPFPMKDGKHEPYVVGRTIENQLTPLKRSTSKEAARAGGSYTYRTEHTVADYLKTFTEMGYSRELILPMGELPLFAQEYSSQATNKITQYSTLGGNSLISFGPLPKKITLRASLIKAGDHWVPFAAMIEAMSNMSGSQAKYSGSLVLYGYDKISIAKTRKYKVMIESVTSSHSATKQIIDYDITFLVSVDYSSEIPSDWGRLAASSPKAKTTNQTKSK